MVRLGQNFLSDQNLLAAIIREAELRPSDVVLEVGPGEGVLTELIAGRARHLHAIELDRSMEPALADLAARDDVTVHWADALDIELGRLDPLPTAMVANLPYSIATPILIESIISLPSIDRWTVMVQLEIAERLRAASGSKVYGAPSLVVQWACRPKLLRRVDRAVFQPRPRVDSALLGLRRAGPGPDEFEHRLIRDAFAHRRKSLARSIELRRPGSLSAARAALAEVGLAEDIRAEAVPVDRFRDFADALRGAVGESKQAPDARSS